MPENNGTARLDRIERALELLIDDHTAQVLLTGRMDELAGRMAELAAAQTHTEQCLNALITVVDGMVRNRPPQQHEGRPARVLPITDIM